MVDRKAYGEVGIMDVGALHIHEELLSEMILESLRALGHTLQRELVFSKFSQDGLEID